VLHASVALCCNTLLHSIHDSDEAVVGCKCGCLRVRVRVFVCVRVGKGDQKVQEGGGS